MLQYFVVARPRYSKSMSPLFLPITSVVQVEHAISVQCAFLCSGNNL